MTFTYTGSEQTYTVPAGMSAVTITAVGAPGGRHVDRTGARRAHRSGQHDRAQSGDDAQASQVPLAWDSELRPDRDSNAGPTA